MNTELINKWVVALESGDYEQTRGRLCEEIEGVKHYCCLGVLAEIAGLENDVFFFSFPTVDADNNPVVQQEIGGATDYWWGITTSNKLGAQSQYWNMNDSDGLTFAEIAAEIRKRLTS